MHTAAAASARKNIRRLSPLIGDGASRTIAAMTSRLLLDEHILADGHVTRTYATFLDGHVRVEDEGGPAGALSVAAVDRVMVRMGCR